MAADMLKRAVRCGIEADYVIAGAWIGTKSILADFSSCGFETTTLPVTV